MIRNDLKLRQSVSKSKDTILIRHDLVKLSADKSATLVRHDLSKLSVDERTTKSPARMQAKDGTYETIISKKLR